MANFAQSKSFAIAPRPLKAIRDEFDAFATDETACADEMARVYRETGYVLDPHSAIGVNAARRALARDKATPMIALATAHPAKFPDAVARSTGRRPALPAHLKDLMERKERFDILPNDLGAVRNYVRAGVRAAA